MTSAGVLAIWMAAIAPAAPTAGASAFVLAVGNNQSLAGSRPDLRYADDDALKYAALFRTTLPSPEIELLTRADDESQRLHPDATITGAPTRAELWAAVERLRSKISGARAAGHTTVLYLTFASHGDQRKGKGYLELEDGELSGPALAEAIGRIGADETHLILDSCNSYFVIHPRRPGGRVWSSDARAAASPLADRDDVGVFLSTSAEAQVFEWSHLQSGVFSHAVRSGLAGAADQDGDAKITYAELDAWVRTATRDLENSLYQPHLYVRPPGPADDDGPGGRVLLDLHRAPGRAVLLDGFEGRVTVRDGRGVRLIDVHPEAGFSPRLIVPERASLSVLASVTNQGRKTLRSAPLDGDVVTPAALTEPAVTARGPVRLLEQLFASPWGPDAFEDVGQSQGDAPAPVYGLSREVERQLGLQLEAMARQSLFERIAIGAAGLAVFAGGGVYLAAAAVYTYAYGAQPANLLVAVILGAFTAFLPGTALMLYALWPDKEERVYAEFQDAPASTDQERAARVASAVDEMVAYSTIASWIRWSAAALLGAFGASGVVLSLGLLAATQFTYVDYEQGETVIDSSLAFALAGLSLGLGFAIVAVAAWIAIDPSEPELLADIATTSARLEGE